MKRVMAGVIIAPIIWPFFQVYFAGIFYILLNGTIIDLHWMAGIDNLHLYPLGYSLMILCGIPLVLIGKKYCWYKLWHFLLGAVLFFPMLRVAYIIGSAVIFQAEFVTASFLLGLLAAISHELLAEVFTFLCMVVLYWCVSIRKNEWFIAE